MTTELALLLALMTCLVLFDLVAALFGADSRDGFADDRRR
jgi:hypothetical protein